MCSRSGKIRRDGIEWRNIRRLGWVSFLTDVSTEMVYPLVPAFLQALGVPMTLIGAIEGLAESTAALMRSVFGRWSDRIGRRKGFIFAGYALSAFAKPCLAFAHSWSAVLAIRFSDRLGKAARTPARDALISTSVREAQRGFAFGYHRAMDQLGAFVGPWIAMGLLRLAHRAPGDAAVRWVFFLSAIPALTALIPLIGLRETAASAPRRDGAPEPSVLHQRPFAHLLIAAIVFTLGNASNAFLLLKARETGVTVAWLPALWGAYNLTGALLSPLCGALSDRWSRKGFITLSFLLHALVYFAFGLARTPAHSLALFLMYGVQYAMSEGLLRAYVADLVPAMQRGTAYGLLNTSIGLALIPASVLFGGLWDRLGSTVAFSVAAGLSFLGGLIFLAGPPPQRSSNR